MKQVLCSDWLDWPSLCSQENWTLPLFFFTLLVNLQLYATGQESKKRRQILCDKRDTNFVWKNLPQTSSSFKQILSFCKRPKQINYWVKITIAEHESNITLSCLSHTSILPSSFFLPSCCINTLLTQKKSI